MKDDKVAFMHVYSVKGWCKRKRGAHNTLADEKKTKTE
jgi:hypothetical protein